MAGLFSFLSNKVVLSVSAITTLAGGAMLLKDNMQGGKYTKTNRVDGRVMIITGANTGIGKETALELAKRGAHVYMACRDLDKCEAARAEIVLESKNKFVYCRECDLASFESVRKFAERFKTERKELHVLINNAGVMRCPKMLTKDGLELQLGTNHMAHFLLTNLLLDHLKQSAPSRIVNVSSLAHVRGEIKLADLNSEQSYDSGKAYSQSKLANVLFTRELAKKLKDSGVTVNSLHPGIVHTELGRHMSFFNSYLAKILVKPFMWPFLKSPKAGAQTTIYAALDPDLDQVTGEYFSDCAPKEVAEAGRDDTVAAWLWAVSAKWCGLDQLSSSKADKISFVINFDTMDIRILDDKGQDLFEQPLEDLERLLEEQIQRGEDEKRLAESADLLPQTPTPPLDPLSSTVEDDNQENLTTFE